MNIYVPTHLQVPEAFHTVPDERLKPLRDLARDYSMGSEHSPDDLVFRGTLLGDGKIHTIIDKKVVTVDTDRVFAAFEPLTRGKAARWLDLDAPEVDRPQFYVRLGDVATGETQGYPGIHPDKFGVNCQVTAISSGLPSEYLWPTTDEPLPQEFRKAWNTTDLQDEEEFRTESGLQSYLAGGSLHPAYDAFVQTLIAEGLAEIRPSETNRVIAHTKWVLHRAKVNESEQTIENRLFARVIAPRS